jgi:hypothetical protein
VPSGCYQFSQYKTGRILDANSSSSAGKDAAQQAGAGSSAAAPDSDDAKPVLVVPQGANVDSVMAMAEAFYWVSKTWGHCRNRAGFRVGCRVSPLLAVQVQG